jgi:hypothetical protein
MIIDEKSYGFKTRTVNSGPKWRLPWPPKYPDYYNKTCHYLDALYSTLVQMNPKYCLEIGTHKGDMSTAVFQKYFNEHRSDGLLITLDIKRCEGLSHPNVEQVLVYPHHKRIYETCGADGRWFSESELPNDFKNVTTTSVQKNTEIVREAMQKHEIEGFDLAFIDGDHERESFLGDLEMCMSITSDPHYVLIDDTKEEYHPCCHIYQEEIKTSGKYTTYDFDNWERFVGCSLVSAAKASG